MRTLATPAIGLILLLSQASCGLFDSSNNETGGPQASAPSLNEATDDLGATIFGRLVAASSYGDAAVKTFGSAEQTWFAPTDAALQDLPAGFLTDLFRPENAADLDRFVEAHSVSNRLYIADLLVMTTVETVAGDRWLAESIAGEATLNGARFLVPGQETLNGILHLIEFPLHPTVDAVATLRREGHGIFADALESTGLAAEIGPGGFAILAPTDQAFADLGTAELDALLNPSNVDALRERLRVHLVPGTAGPCTLGALLDAGAPGTAEGSRVVVHVDGAGVPSVNHATFARFNLPATSSVVHAVDTVLPIPMSAADVASGAGLETFGTLLFASGLGTDLDGAEPRTLFVPTNAALAATDMLDDLVNPANLAELQAFLRGHAVGAARTSAQLLAVDAVTTLAGTSVDVTSEGGSITLNGAAPLVDLDVYTRSGVLHILEGVLPDVGSQP